MSKQVTYTSKEAVKQLGISKQVLYFYKLKIKQMKPLTMKTAFLQQGTKPQTELEIEKGLNTSPMLYSVNDVIPSPFKPFPKGRTAEEGFEVYLKGIQHICSDATVEEMSRYPLL